jgi:hypothetical protein
VIGIAMAPLGVSARNAAAVGGAAAPLLETLMEIWLRRALLVASWALLLWLLLRQLVPAHPIEQPPEALCLAAALACGVTAGVIAQTWGRRLLLGIAVAFVIATFVIL